MGAESEVESTVGGGEETAAAKTLGDLGLSRRRDSDASTHSVAVCGGPFQFQCEEVTLRWLDSEIVKIRERTRLR